MGDKRLRNFGVGGIAVHAQYLRRNEAAIRLSRQRRKVAVFEIAGDHLPVQLRRVAHAAEQAGKLLLEAAHHHHGAHVFFHGAPVKAAAVGIPARELYAAAGELGAEVLPRGLHGGFIGPIAPDLLERGEEFLDRRRIEPALPVKPRRRAADVERAEQKGGIRRVKGQSVRVCLRPGGHVRKRFHARHPAPQRGQQKARGHGGDGALFRKGRGDVRKQHA